MEILVQFWLPILASAVVVFLASSIAWMVLPHHKKDVKTLPDEKAGVLAPARQPVDGHRRTDRAQRGTYNRLQSEHSVDSEPRP